MDSCYPFRQRFEISSDYGNREYWLNGKLMRDFHRGIDFLTPMRTEVIAPFDGNLDTYTDETGALYAVMIKAGTNERWDFIHMDEVINPIRKVKQGDPIAYTGKSGYYVTGPHCHLEIRGDWIGQKTHYVDPTFVTKLPMFVPVVNLSPELKKLQEENAKLQKQLQENEMKREQELQNVQNDLTAQIQLLYAEAKEKDEKINELVGYKVQIDKIRKNPDVVDQVEIMIKKTNLGRRIIAAWGSWVDKHTTNDATRGWLKYNLLVVILSISAYLAARIPLYLALEVEWDPTLEATLTAMATIVGFTVKDLLPSYDTNKDNKLDASDIQDF